MKGDDTPMHPGWRLTLAVADAAPRCRALAKRTGQPCRAPAVTGWRVCRMHGARGGHAPGPGPPSWRHGMRSHEAVEMRRLVNRMGRVAREIDGLTE